MAGPSSLLNGALLSPVGEHVLISCERTVLFFVVLPPEQCELPMLFEPTAALVMVAKQLWAPSTLHQEPSDTVLPGLPAFLILLLLASTSARCSNA